VSPCSHLEAHVWSHPCQLVSLFGGQLASLVSRSKLSLLYVSRLISVDVTQTWYYSRSIPRYSSYYFIRITLMLRTLNGELYLKSFRLCVCYRWWRLQTSKAQKRNCPWSWACVWIYNQLLSVVVEMIHIHKHVALISHVLHSIRYTAQGGFASSFISNPYPFPRSINLPPTATPTSLVHER
jgi:hypothetical protein